MATDRSQAYYRGLLVPDSRMQTVWSAQSSYTEYGARAGDPDPGQTTALDMRGSGSQTATVYTATQQAGLPGRGWNAASTRYRLGTSELWRGWDVPVAQTGWEAVRWVGGAVSAVTVVSYPHALTLPDGTVLCAADVTYIDGMTTTYRVGVYVRSPTAHTWSFSTSFETATAITQDYHPCLLRLPSGRVICMYWVVDSVKDEGQIRVYYSDDSGATWTLQRSHILEAAVDVSGAPGAGSAGYDLGRIRAIYHDGRVCIVGHLLAHNTTPTYRDVLRQWVSYDQACSAELVEDTDTATEGGQYHDLTLVDGQIILTYISDVDIMPYARRVASALDSLADAADIAVAAGTEVWGSLDGLSQYLDEGDLAACVDEDGVLYVYGRQPTASGEGIVARSNDAGATWGGMGQSTATAGLSMWWAPTDAATYPTQITATMQRGRALILHRFVADPGTADPSLCCTYLGGYTSVTMPGYADLPTDLARVSWEKSWLPYDEPGDVSWTVAGAGTETLASGRLEVTTAGGTARTYTRNPPGTIAEGMIVRVAMAAVSGGSLAANYVSLRLRLADGTDDYDIILRFDEAGMRLYDINGSAQIGSDMVIAVTSGVEVLIAMNAGKVDMWYRARSTSQDKLWIAGPSSDALTNDAVTPAANHMVEWGHGAAGDAVSYWYEVHYVSDEWAGQGLVDPTWPDDLWGRALSTSPVYQAAGLSLSATAGPTVSGDTWTTTPAYDYAFTRCLPSVFPSPRRGWKNAAHNVTEYVAFALNTTLLGTAEGVLDTDMVGMAVFGTNLESIQLQGYDTDTSTWSTLATLTLTNGMTAMNWVRRGASVVPDATEGTSTPYLLRGEYDGGTYDLDGTLRTIATHTEGRHGIGSSRKVVIHLSGVTGGEGASGTAGKIRSRSGVVIFKLLAARYAGYRIRIPAQATVSGYYEIGTLVLGPVIVWGWDPSWGRAHEEEDGAEIVERRDRTWASYVPAPTRRLVEVAWPDGVDTSDALEDAAPDYCLDAAGGVAVATPADLPWVLEGLARQVDGQAQPVVYLPRIPYSGSSAITVRREEHMLAHISGPIRREVVVGDEASTELVRIDKITAREIV